jgi:hypothetical protein
MRRKPEAVEQQIGQEMLAPLLADFARWIHEQAVRDGRTRILFLARDGYMIQRAYQLVIPETEQLPSMYVLGSRRLYAIPSIKVIGDVELAMLLGDKVVMPVASYLERIGLDPATCEAEARGVGFRGTADLVSSRDRETLRVLLRVLEPRSRGGIFADRRRLAT